MRRRSFTRRLWIPEEDRVIDRYARALAANRYGGLMDATRACAREIERLYASLRKTDPRHHVASRERPLASLRQRMRTRLVTLGLPVVGPRLTPQEERVVSRHVRDLVGGRYHDARKAAEACFDELSHLAGIVGRARQLPLATVQNRIYHRGRELGMPWAWTRWSTREAATANRYARALARGEYATARAAALACHSELARRGRSAGGIRAAGRPLETVEGRICGLMNASGLQRLRRWNKAEQQVMNRYVRALYAGRFRHVRPAANACARELQERFGRSTGSAGSGFGPAGCRSSDAVHQAMTQVVMRLGLPRHQGDTTSAERLLFEKYARSVYDGKFRNCFVASQACAGELRLLYKEAAKRYAPVITTLAGRTPRSIQYQIVEAVHRLKLHIPGSRWTEEENKLVREWLRWYERHRLARRLTPLRTAVSGLSEDLENIGSRRSRRSCEWRVLTEHHRLHGMA